jgi:SAM-dependent methyltransferase
MRALFVTLFFAANAGASGLTCDGLFAPDYRAWNPTAALSAEAYSAPNARPYRDYEKILRPTIPNGATVLDLGGGQGRAMYDLATRKDVDAIVVNTQDFTGRYPERPDRGRLSYVTGWAEDVLSRIPESRVDVVLDFFGAFHYSARKDLLVEGIYRVLKPGASASLLFDYQNSQAFVGRMRFDRYLESVNPEVFSVRTSILNGREVSVLKITKPRARRWFEFARISGRVSGPAPLTLDLEIASVEMNPRLRLAVPRVWYRARE